MIRALLRAGASLVLSAGCAPPPSEVPLGLGPLAIAEQDAQLQARARQPRPKPERARRSSEADAPPSAKAEVKDADAKPEPEAREEKATAKSAAAPAFEGLYAGRDIAVYRWAGEPEREERDDKAKIRIDKLGASSVSITLVNSADGSDLCELAARVEGNAAVIESPQPCFGDGSELTSGRAVLEGDRLKMDAEGTLSITLPDQELLGELSYSFKGERQ